MRCQDARFQFDYDYDSQRSAGYCSSDVCGLPHRGRSRSDRAEPDAEAGADPRTLQDRRSWPLQHAGRRVHGKAFDSGSGRSRGRVQRRLRGLAGHAVRLRVSRQNYWQVLASKQVLPGSRCRRTIRSFPLPLNLSASWFVQKEISPPVTSSMEPGNSNQGKTIISSQ